MDPDCKPKAICRCGYSGEGPHPCHGKGYSCGKPAREHFYNPTLVALSGVQMKLGVTQTWACDECWAALMAKRAEALKALKESNG